MTSFIHPSAIILNEKSVTSLALSDMSEAAYALAAALGRTTSHRAMAISMPPYK